MLVPSYSHIPEKSLQSTEEWSIYVENIFQESK